MPTKPSILVINASRIGRQGNSQRLAEIAARHLRRENHVEVVALIEQPGHITNLLDRIARSDGLLILTGTHWDSWSSRLQEFLENATASEGTDVWMGKPAAVIVSEHSTGGKGVLSRLQGVLATFGALIPPMSGMVYSLAGQNSIETDSPGSSDVWCLDDIKVVCKNLSIAAKLKVKWTSWPVDRKNVEQVWVAS